MPDRWQITSTTRDGKSTTVRLQGSRTNPPPSLTLVASVEDGPAPLTVTFTVTGTAGLTYGWDLDDDLDFTDATGPTVIHEFVTAGSYPVRVRGTGPQGRTVDAVTLITVHEAPLEEPDPVDPEGDIVPPAHVAGMGTAPFDTRVVVAWFPPNDADISHYRLYRQTATGTWAAFLPNATVMHTGQVVHYWIDTGRTNGTEYFYRVIPVDLAGNSPTFDEAPIRSATPTAPAVAKLTANTVAGNAPLTVNVDASASLGTNNTYTWDLDDDGLFDDATGPTATVVFDTPGTYTITVKATNTNNVDTATLIVTVADSQIVVDVQAELGIMWDGTDTTDLSTPLQAIFNKKRGSPLSTDNIHYVFPTGLRIRAEKTITIGPDHYQRRKNVPRRKNITISGNGCWFVQNTEGAGNTTRKENRNRSMFLFQNVDNLTVDQVKVEGAHKDADTSPDDYVAKLEAQHGFELLSVVGAQFTDCRVEKVYGDFIFISQSGSGALFAQGPSQWVAFTDFFGRGCGRQGIALTYCAIVSFLRTQARDVRRTTFDIEPGGSSTVTAVFGVLVDDLLVVGEGSGNVLSCASDGYPTVEDVEFTNVECRGHIANAVIRSAADIRKQGKVNRRNFRFSHWTSNKASNGRSFWLMGVDTATLSNLRLPSKAGMLKYTTDFDKTAAIIIDDRAINTDITVDLDTIDHSPL